MNPTAIAIDLGGTAIKYGLVDINGQVLWEGIVPTPLGAKEEIINELLRCADRVKAANPQASPLCIGIGTPGLVDYTTGYISGAATQLPSWENFPLGAIISREAHLPAYVDNDANLMGLGEFVFGKTGACRNAIFITVGTGIGGAIFINGELYRGSKNAGGELGCIPFFYEGRQVYWEDFVSMKAMIGRYKNKKNETEILSAWQIFERATAGEPEAQAIIAENAQLLGYGIGGYINVFNPDKVIIGGGVSDTETDYIERVKAAAFVYALPDCCHGLEIVAASLGNKAGFIGAGFFALSMHEKAAP